ncbi:MAG TPA: hypothetical protein VI756_13225, partial [Blastocatellia bacterium]
MINERNKKSVTGPEAEQGDATSGPAAAKKGPAHAAQNLAKPNSSGNPAEDQLAALREELAKKEEELDDLRFK